MSHNDIPLSKDQVKDHFLITCYKLIQLVMVTGLFAGQHNTKLHGTITGVIYMHNTREGLEARLILLKYYFSLIVYLCSNY